jgi:glycosyltransferase involved in cell wall biosynthesis
VDILFLSPADWEGVRGRFHHFAIQLAQHNRVLYVDSIGLRPTTLDRNDVQRILRRLLKRITGARLESAAADQDATVRHISPLVLPLRRRKWIITINRILLLRFLRAQMRRYGFHDPLIWIAYPHPDVVAIIDRLSRGPVIYDCVDAWDQFRGLHDGLRESEIALFQSADAVLATTIPLRERARRHGRHAHVVPNGVDIEGYRRTLLNLRRPPADLEPIPPPRIGFIGNIAQWVDLPMLTAIAHRRPDWHFILIGPWQRSEPCCNLANIHWLGPKSYREVPEYISGFDVSIIPFAVDELTRAVDPLKLYEYMAVGSAVVATPLPAVSADIAAEVRWARSADEFEAAIAVALEDDPSRKEVRRALAARHSWNQRFTLAAEILHSELGLQLTKRLCATK